MKPILRWVTFISLATALQAAAPARRPNILVIVTDDQRYDALGVVQREQGDRARFPFLQTPNLDRLATEGARFRNAFVTHSLCSPSRASMLTGQQTYAHGIRDNRTPFRSEQTWAHALRDAGYRTGYFGKWHMGQQEDRPGFTATFTFVDQGVYPNCRFLQNGVWVDTQGWVDDVTTDRAIDYIRANWAQHGRSLLPVLGGQPPADWRTSFFYENYRDPEYPDVTFDIHAVRTRDAKLVTYPGRPEWTEVFDLRADPYETRNLARDPAADELVQRLRGELVRCLAATSQGTAKH